jgi:hypothetical protein
LRLGHPPRNATGRISPTTFRIRRGEDTMTIQLQAKTFYNSSSSIMLGVFTDVTPATA